MLRITYETEARIAHEAASALQLNDDTLLVNAAHSIHCVLCFCPLDTLTDPLFQIAERLSKKEKYTTQALISYLMVVNKSTPAGPAEKRAINAFTKLFDAAMADPRRVTSVYRALNTSGIAPSSNCDFQFEMRAKFVEVVGGRKPIQQARIKIRVFGSNPTPSP